MEQLRNGIQLYSNTDLFAVSPFIHWCFLEWSCDKIQSAFFILKKIWKSSIGHLLLLKKMVRYTSPVPLWICSLEEWWMLAESSLWLLFIPILILIKVTPPTPPRGRKGMQHLQKPNARQGKEGMSLWCVWQGFNTEERPSECLLRAGRRRRGESGAKFITLSRQR